MSREQIMSREIAWHRTIAAKLGGITVALLGASLLLIIGNLYMLSQIRGDGAVNSEFNRGSRYLYQLLYLAYRSQDKDFALTSRDELDRLLTAMDDRFERLQAGDPQRGIPGVTDPISLAGIRSRYDKWRNDIRPSIKRVIGGHSGDEVPALLHSIGDMIDDLAAQTDKGGERIEEMSASKVRRFQGMQYVFTFCAVLILGPGLFISHSIVRRIRSLAGTADQITAGDLSLRAALSGHDEIAALGRAIDRMTASLRRTIETERESQSRIAKLLETEQEVRARNEQLLEKVREAVGQLTTASAEILASTTQQAAGAQEQALSVSETVTTVDEVTQTAEQAAQRARGVGEVVSRTQEIGNAGRKAVEDAGNALTEVKDRVESTAENILALAEQAQAIGTIIATVNDIAEQTNLLALNAAIEASRAGEHGKGFSVVAGEVKALADQSKKATAQVRQILGEIQKATNTAVLSTEEVTKGVTAATRIAAQAGDAIRSLTETLADTAQASVQIVASAGQQATGMVQIHQAIKNIEQVAKQNTAATRQVEQAAHNLNSLSRGLAELSQADAVHADGNQQSAETIRPSIHTDSVQQTVRPRRRRHEPRNGSDRHCAVAGLHSDQPSNTISFADHPIGE